MAGENGNGNGGLIGAWLRSAGPVLELLNKIGFTTFLLLMIGLGLLWASGVIPLKPFDDLSAEHTALERAVLAAQEGELERDRTRAEIVERLAAAIARMDRRAQLIDCARLTDPDLRKRCLE